MANKKGFLLCNHLLSDAGVFVFLYRDLKPSNVYIQEDDSIAIGDFGVSTVMVDVLTRTRSTVGMLIACYTLI